MEPPWILILCHEFPPLGGGAGKNLFLLCRELTSRGVKVKVWTEDPGERKRHHYDFEVEYIEVGRKERFRTSYKGMAAFIILTCLRGFGLRSNPPAMVFSVLGIPSGIAGNFISRLTRVPLVVWYHGSDIHGGRTRGPGVVQRFLLRRIWNRAAMNFFVSKGLQKMAATFGVPKLSSLLSACPSPEILAYPNEGGDKMETRYFLFLGRFDPVKQPMLALQAVELLKNRGIVTRRFRMVGGGVLLDALQNFICSKSLSPHAVIEGSAAIDTVPELLRQAYALILPSRIEGFNTTLLESAHFGVPAIASDVQGIGDFVKHGENGLLFKENDVESLAQAMQALDADPTLRDKLGMAARASALPYNPKQVADDFLAGISKVCKAV